MDQPTLTFWGAARNVTGSRHLLHANGEQLLLDCGLFQGRRAEANQQNRELPFKAKDVAAVVLSHAHMDHAGNLPTLVKRGFRGKIHCTPATADLIDVMLRDSAHIQERDAEWLNKRRKRGQEKVEPLYALKDVERCLKLVEPQRYRTPFSVRPGVTGLWQVRRTREPETDFQEWIRFDLEYVQRMSWRLDIWIIVQTMKSVVKG